MKTVRFGALLLPLVLMACSTSESSSTNVEQNETAVKACAPVLACAAPAPAPFASRPWRHSFQSWVTRTEGAARHRGRDLFVNPAAAQTVIGKIAYGVIDKDLEDEEVDVFVQRTCNDGWELLGTTITTGGGAAHPAVEGVDDSGGRVYFEIPDAKRLGAGRHRVRLVVAGDGTSTDLFLDVVDPGTPLFVSDVDGTLTSSEDIEFVKLLEGTLPDTHPDAPEALSALAAKGYRSIYLTARPEWLTQRTRDFLDARGFPAGLVHTSTSALGAGLGANAASFKTDELAMLAAKGLVPAFAFGNMSSDSDAYAAANIQPPDHRIFFQVSGAFVGRRIDAYNELLPGFNAIPTACQ